MVRIGRGLLGVVVAASLALGSWVASDELAEQYAYGFEKVSITGVPNAGRVNPHLYRGGQPTAAGLAALRSLGVTTIVSFTLEGEDAKSEAAASRTLGLQFIHLPWSASGEPPEDYVSQFLELASPTHSGVVFAHCKAGADRTGLMIAAYRVLSDGWPLNQALDEMDAFGYEVEFHPQLRRFVRNLALKRIASS